MDYVFFLKEEICHESPLTLICCLCLSAQPLGNKTKDGMVAGVNTVAQRTTDQANIVGDATVAGANELSQQTVEGMENAAVNSGLVNQEQEEAVALDAKPEVAGSGSERVCGG
ncbi:synuclein-like isoform X2 [Oncorhynchus masou masou]|uniref:synuclein-like isoform X2 n=1 Tax=Oncorhynchus masou masou TaxID=90313 RepID=UPI0031834CEC